MSGRIRTIKPELLEDAKTARLGHLEFRLFVAMLLMADDYGNLRASAAFIRGTVFWGCDEDEDEIERAVAELEEAGLLTGYEMRGQRYVHISGWAKHQRVDKPGKPRVPSPSEPEVRPARPWVTYFIRLGDDGPIKIGRTFDVDARLPKLQTGAPKPLKVLRIIKGDHERDLHIKFDALRQHGEWFDPAPELIRFIETESFENYSRMIRAPFAPDLRPPTTTETTDQAPAADAASGVRVVVPLVSPEDEPEPTQGMKRAAREGEYRKAYIEGIAEGGGGTIAVLSKHQGDLNTAIQAFARDDDGRPYTKARLLEWIRCYAADFAEDIQARARDKPEVRGWFSSLLPAGFAKWLSERSQAQMARAIP